MQANRQIKQIIGENIRARRDELGWSRAELAARMASADGRPRPVEPVLIYKWERGQHRPTDDNLDVVAAVLERDRTWFYTDHDEEKVAAA